MIAILEAEWVVEQYLIEITGLSFCNGGRVPDDWHVQTCDSGHR